MVRTDNEITCTLKIWAKSTSKCASYSSFNKRLEKKEWEEKPQCSVLMCNSDLTDKINTKCSKIYVKVELCSFWYPSCVSKIEILLVEKQIAKCEFHLGRSEEIFIHTSTYVAFERSSAFTKFCALWWILRCLWTRLALPPPPFLPLGRTLFSGGLHDHIFCLQN